jgi:hypothetical protein
MKLDKRYQLTTIQHTMRCLRGCFDTAWDALFGGYSEDFPGKKDWTAEFSALREKIKELEQRAYDERERRL